ncbi:hypothetical protein C2E21_9467 [Chlorella sorokiniana]|uniref:Uncharacterized protein n=1 Tax=Chlorella sorokiniana TaxID=3076 RepID=A0A2P6TB99_CHLSO|nr:hypothetical protein C2E21_9467 [Chlorella sorokiniana]|eukprot:PRW05826.1 hypothetical protein C2E21_9467 [Chlorella sorokiniana]
MALRAAAALACRGGAARSLCSAGGGRGVATSAAGARLLAAKGHDHPDIPGRHPDIWPPTPHDSPDPDIYPPAPDMPEPGSPRQGPYMALGAPGMCAPKVPMAGEVPLFVLRSPTHAAVLAGRPGGAALLLKTDGGNSWLEGRATQQSLASFRTRSFHAGAPARQEQPSRGNVPPEVPPRQPTEAPDQLPASSPPESQPGYTHATGAPTAHIGKVSDDTGDVPDQTESGMRGVSPKVGPKASPGTPLDKPTEVPKPGFPGAATTQKATKLSEDADIEH